MLQIRYYESERGRSLGIATTAYIECSTLDDAKLIVKDWNLGFGISMWEFKISTSK